MADEQQNMEEFKIDRSNLYIEEIKEIMDDMNIAKGIYNGQ